MNNTSTIIKTRTNLVYPELSYELNGLFFTVHNDLGRFCREKQYCDAFEKVLKLKGVKYLREFRLNSLEKEISGNIVDFYIENKILVDFKAKRFITKEDYYQMMRYLESSGIKLGLIVNFRNTYLKPKRIINIKN